VVFAHRSPVDKKGTCYRHYVVIETAVALNEYVYESAKACADAAGQTVAEWISEAVRITARRQNAAAYVAWEAAHGHAGWDELDKATAAASLEGAEW
jgi:hypothetical protein